MERLLSIQKILSRCAGRQRTATGEANDDSRRRTDPKALTTLLLRFITEAGPRTIVATGIPLHIAADIAQEMLRAGHFADYVDEFPRLTMAERIKRRKLERAGQAKGQRVVKLAGAAVASR